ncbi:hypothetical protein [Chitinasiproducens palmae]|uniref:Uncharacterized protein n=1 Tax=Chitinasiproducens palmae TaxID=1770053 RepID=A0A1H2PQN8_9BURK|nr:hypothetical protein [Chitinasiproducens palmae]SDV49131.1 hypothetical protein SAMN05216551_10790 [Chitinasiproducens palmae]
MAIGKVGALAVMTIDTAKAQNQWCSAYVVTVTQGGSQRVVFYQDIADRIFADRSAAASHALEAGMACARDLGDKLMAGVVRQQASPAATVLA